MKTLKTVILTACIALPIGAFAKDAALKGHPNLEKARASLNEADMYISKSQTANEGVWKDEGKHGEKAKEAIAEAKKQLDMAAEWVNNHH